MEDVPSQDAAVSATFKTLFEEKKCHRCELYTAHKLLYLHCWEGKSGVWWLEVPNSHTNTLLIRQTNEVLLHSCNTLWTCSWPLQDEGNGLLPSRGPFNQPGIYVDLTFPRQEGFYNQGDNGLGEFSYQAHVTRQKLLWLEFQKEQILYLKARRVALLGEILGQRCSCSVLPIPHKKTYLWALLPCFIPTSHWQLPSGCPQLRRAGETQCFSFMIIFS